MVASVFHGVTQDITINGEPDEANFSGGFITFSNYIPVAVDWFQVVSFVEVGRVNDQYDFDLLADMKYDIGISLRAMVVQLPVRLELHTVMKVQICG